MIQVIGKVAACSVLYAEGTSARAVRNFTSGVGRQYIGEIGKTDNGIVVVTSHLYDGTKSLPLDIEGDVQTRVTVLPNINLSSRTFALNRNQLQLKKIV